MIEGLMILAFSLGFALFISRTLGVHTRRGKRSAPMAPLKPKRGKGIASVRLVFAVVASALLLSLLVALFARYLVNLLERSLG